MESVQIPKREYLKQQGDSERPVYSPIFIFSAEVHPPSNLEFSNDEVVHLPSGSTLGCKIVDISSKIEYLTYKEEPYDLLRFSVNSEIFKLKVEIVYCGGIGSLMSQVSQFKKLFSVYYIDHVEVLIKLHNEMDLYICECDSLPVFNKVDKEWFCPVCDWA